MAHVHCRRGTKVQTRIQIRNLMVTLYYTEYVHIVQTRTQIPAPYFCTEQESESKSVFESVYGNEHCQCAFVLA